MQKISECSLELTHKEIWLLKRRSPLVLGLFTAVLFAAAPAIAVPVAIVPNQLISQQPTASAPTLTLQDLPSGFHELPPPLKQQLATWLEPFKQLLGRANLPLTNFFAFANLEKFEVVFGFTGILPNQPLALASFDTALKQLQQTTGRQQLISNVRERLQAVLGVEIVEYKALPELNNLANASTGMSLAVSLRGQPLRVDVAGFRRNTIGAFTAVLYLDGKPPLSPVSNLVNKLDNRIMQSSSSPEAKGIYHR
jgi:hypothetical protein